MFCPKCGNALVEGAAFCTNCGYQIPQNIQPEPQAVSQPQAQPSAAPAYQPETVAAAAPAKEKYFSKVLKVIVIILAGLALTYGLVSRIVWGSSFGNILLYTLLPTTALIVTAVLMNKVPPILAIIPVGVELLVSTIEVFESLDWYGWADYLLYLVITGIAVMFLLYLLTGKTVFRLISIILTCLITGHMLVFLPKMYAASLLYYFEWFGLDALEYLFDDRAIFGSLMYINYVVYYYIALILFILGVKKKG